MIFLRAWLLMLTIGALHSHVSAVPAIGYWATFWLAVSVNLLLAGQRRAVPITQEGEAK